MTLQQIIYLLKQEGRGSKQQVLNMLKNANRAELTELRNSIDIKLELEKIKYEKEKQH